MGLIHNAPINEHASRHAHCSYKNRNREKIDDSMNGLMTGQTEISGCPGAPA
jgi:hypothetical protein